MKIRMVMLGKTRRPEMRALIEEYVKRIRRWCPIEATEVRDAEGAIKQLDASRTAAAFLLDAAGKPHDSESFAAWIGALRDRGARELVFICGDSEGFPAALRRRVPQGVALSLMTYSHELARVMLAEQLYRAFAILSGSPYPK